MNNQAKNSIPSRDRNPAEFAVLGGLALGPGHGYDLHQRLTELLGGVWRLGLSQVYGLLGRLEKAALVEHDRVDQGGRPAKKIYRLTPEGSTELTAWLDRPVSSIREIRLEFMAKLALLEAIDSGRAADLVRRQQQECRSVVGQFRADLAQAEPGTPLHRALDFRLTQTQAVVDWLDRIG